MTTYVGAPVMTAPVESTLGTGKVPIHNQERTLLDCGSGLLSISPFAGKSHLKHEVHCPQQMKRSRKAPFPTKVWGCDKKVCG